MHKRKISLSNVEKVLDANHPINRLKPFSTWENSSAASINIIAKNYVGCVVKVRESHRSA